MASNTFSIVFNNDLIHLLHQHIIPVLKINVDLCEGELLQHLAQGREVPLLLCHVIISVRMPRTKVYRDGWFKAWQLCKIKIPDALVQTSQPEKLQIVSHHHLAWNTRLSNEDTLRS